MNFECISVNGFAGDRTPDAMQECHDFATAFADYFNFPVSLVGRPATPRNLSWDQALLESTLTFSSTAENLTRIFSRGLRPILITPRCATAIASLPVIAARHPDVIILYFDAHGDLNTPETTESGYLGGMPITAALGEWDSGYGSGLKIENLIHIGGRDLDAAEKAFLERNQILTVSKKQIESNLERLVDRIKARPVYIHLDTDVFDPSEVTAEYAVENGLYRHHVQQVVDVVLTNGDLVGFEITELSPKNNHQRVQSYTALFESFHGLLNSNIVSA